MKIRWGFHEIEVVEEDRMLSISKDKKRRPDHYLYGIYTERTIVKAARDYAIKKHSAQTYGAGRPYVSHLDHVAEVASRYRLNNIIFAACYLHDVLEDVPEVSVNDIEDLFGTRVAEIVMLCTDDPASGATREERKAVSLRHIRKDESAVCVKLCDRIANVEASICDQSKKHISMYVNEHDAFRRLLLLSKKGRYCDPIPKMAVHLNTLIESAK